MLYFKTVITSMSKNTKCNANQNFIIHYLIVQRRKQYYETILTFYDRCDSIQVKRDLMSSLRNFVYEFPHELPNGLRLRIFRKLGNEKKISELDEGRG